MYNGTDSVLCLPQTIWFCLSSFPAGISAVGMLH